MSQTKEFIDLITENPNLPVVPLVDGEICLDDCHWWLGTITCAKKGEIALYGERWYDDRRSFTEEYYDDHAEELCTKFSFQPDMEYQHNKFNKYSLEEIELNRERERKMEIYLETELSDKYFKPCIILYIGLPEVS